jgi:hypothetical protein
MRLEIIASAALAAVLCAAFAPIAAADDNSGTGTPMRLAQADGPMVITPKPYADQPGTYSGQPGTYSPPPGGGGYDSGGPGTAYEPAPQPEPYANQGGGGTFSPEEIKDAGHRFFGRVSMEFARVVEYAFQRAGRPNGYILGEEAGGAFVAGLRYGEGTLHTKDAGNHRIFWQGPSLGYDFGAEGSKTMVLVYDLRSPGQIFNTYAGVDGSAYFIGGVGITFLARDDVTLAPIRSGIGLRLGANIGYLKYTREPTWNPF